MADTDPEDHVRAEAERGGGWYAALARTGWTAKGLSYAIVGVLALKLALGDGGKATAAKERSTRWPGNGFGKALPRLLAIGFASLCPLALRPGLRGARGGKAARKRSSQEVGQARRVRRPRADLCGAHVLDGEDPRSAPEAVSRRTRRHTRRPPSSSPGRQAPGSSGSPALAVIGVGLWNLYRGIARKFDDRWTTGCDGPHGSQVGRTGRRRRTSWPRAVVFALIGVFVIKAACRLQPEGCDRLGRRLCRSSRRRATGLTCSG